MCGQLFLRIILKGGQYNGLLVFVRQLLNFLGDTRTEICVVEVLDFCFWNVKVFYWDVLRVYASEVVEDSISCNLIDPRREFGRVLELKDLGLDFQKNL